MSGNDEKDKHVVRSTAGTGETFDEVLNQRISRRNFLKTATVASVLAVASKVVADAATAEAANAAAPRLTAIPPRPRTEDNVVVANGYYARTLLRWGEPLTADAPEFDVWKQTPEAQAKQFGYNNDFVGFLPFVYGSRMSNRGLLVVNHEYTNPELMFPGYNPAQPTQTQINIELAAHGMSVVEIQRAPDGTWSYNRNSDFNRRVTAESLFAASGPAAGHAWMQTTEDPTGRSIRGTLNNCSGGKTPWGTVVSGEENFHQYFANLAALPDDDPRKAVHKRYGIPSEASERRWEEYYTRFNVVKEPNEPFRFGWAVEIDPYDPSMTPVKRTALGRFRHEAATFAIASSGQVVAYQGDDSQFEYVYKFVSNGRLNRGNRQANMGLLDDGTLYAAKLNADGSGQWLPLVFGQGPLTPENGFASQADVLIKTRMAADLVGATKMDRPEDIETNPANGKVYMVMTNNTKRGIEGQTATDPANPRSKNSTGHIIEVTEQGNNHAATRFSWDIFLLAGDPAVDSSVYFAGYSPEQVSPIASPDNITFDRAGNLWIATDGAPNVIGYNDGFFVVPVAGTQRGHLKQFFSGPTGSEVTGPEFTPDERSLFLAIQHPGEGGTFEEPISTWPDRQGMPRPSVVTVQAYNGRPIGG